jgi:hypothetical protein
VPEGRSQFSDRCLYTFLDNGIHLIVLKQATRQALDECFEYAAQVYRSASPEIPLRLIIDLRAADLPPLFHVAHHVVRLRRLTPRSQPRRIAFIYAGDSGHAFLHRGIAWLSKPRRDTVQYFPHTQWDNATEWLLSVRA